MSERISDSTSTTDRVRVRTKERADRMARDRRWPRTESYDFAFDVLESLKPDELQRAERRVNERRERQTTAA